MFGWQKSWEDEPSWGFIEEARSYYAKFPQMKGFLLFCAMLTAESDRIPRNWELYLAHLPEHRTRMAAAHKNMLFEHMKSDFLEFMEQHWIVDWLRILLGYIVLHTGRSYSYEALKDRHLAILCNCATVVLVLMVIQE
jgi:hypothetical protein